MQIEERDSRSGIHAGHAHDRIRLRPNHALPGDADRALHAVTMRPRTTLMLTFCSH